MEGGRVPRCDGRSRSNGQRNEGNAVLEIRDALLPEKDSRGIQKDVGVRATSEERRYTVVGDTRTMKNTMLTTLSCVVVAACASASVSKESAPAVPVYLVTDVAPSCAYKEIGYVQFTN